MNANASTTIQQLWADLMIEELVRNGIEYFCLSPGSRCTPLTLAVANNKKARRFIHLDERAMAYHALGYAAAKKGGVVLITTSGTAVANLFPAVIEASKKKIPLIILTADRPPELRHTGANQTIDQVKIFGDYVRFFYDVPVPDESIKPDYVLTTIDQAVCRSKADLAGPVHLNCMYREPLLPPIKGRVSRKYVTSITEWLKSDQPKTTYTLGRDRVASEELGQVADKLNKIKSGVIVVGKLPDEQSKAGVLAIAEKLQWPIFPDLTSGLRLGVSAKGIIPYFDQLLAASAIDKMDGVLHLGGRITSKRWYQLVEKTRPKEYVMVLNHALRNDPGHQVTQRIYGHIGEICHCLSKVLKKRSSHSILTRCQKENTRIGKYFDREFDKNTAITEPAVCRSVSQLITPDHALYAASSLPIRELDTFANPYVHPVDIGSNRGASGIDGTIASATGFANGLSKPTTLIIGDLAFLYDLNSLSMLKGSKYPLTVVVLNNDGGGIFQFLPVAKRQKEFEEYFATPHGLNLVHCAKLFQLRYDQPTNMEEFRIAYIDAINQNASSIIEVKTDKKENFNYQQKLCRQVAQVVTS